MDVVVIPDHRAPVVTHMVWYRVGAADGPSHRSGLAHFLEHLMFKSTEKIPDGAFAKIVMQRGGQLNAFTSQDVTAYFERVAKEHLAQMMEMEADRMVNLRLSEEEVTTERQVIIEERASRYDSNPGARLQEQMQAALHLAHPYRLPVIGWAHDIAALTREDALSFYKRYYAPNNAILVVAGDVTVAEVESLAEASYGRIAANPGVATRTRAHNPPHEAARRITLKDPLASHASLHRLYVVPSYVTAEPGEAEALGLLMSIVGDGATGRLFRKLVLEDKAAASVSGSYMGSGFDSGVISLQAIAPHGDLDSVEYGIDRVLEDVRRNGVTDMELARAKQAARVRYIFESDDQDKLANRYGGALANGRSIAAVERWPQSIAAVTAADIQRVAGTHLDARRSVTGWLLPERETARAIPAPIKQSPLKQPPLKTGTQ